MASRGELKIADILDANQIDYVPEYIFPDLISSSGRPLRFDFAVFDDSGDIDYLIEFQGKQHYTSIKHFGGSRTLHQQRYNDLQKRKYCYKYDYPLLVIPYWDYDALDYDYIYKHVEELR